MMKAKSEELLRVLKLHYPSATSTLNFKNDYECLVAIVLSAQTSDKSVNEVTPSLFNAFPDLTSLATASLPKVEGIIKHLGLYHAKATNLIKLAQKVNEEYQGIIPHEYKELIVLPGVGNKTARVFLLERLNEPAIPVDTHVKRISVRLGLAKDKEEPIVVEKHLEALFDPEVQGYVHHALIYFGREICVAQKPKCSICELKNECPYFKRCSMTKGK
jgi:endonuclease-3